MNETDVQHLDIPATDLLGGDTIVGEAGGRTLVHEVANNSLLPGFVTVTTEHGALLLDNDQSITHTIVR